MKMIKLIIAALAMSVSAATSLNAQKLPNIQKESLYASTDIIIDGNISDWNNETQAYNKSTDLYYSVANDNKNLYLLVRANKNDIITKIIYSGITFAINVKEKNDKGSFAITYPRYKKGERPTYFSLNNKPPDIKDSIKYRSQIDTFINEKNKQLSQRLKYVGIKNIPQTADSVISFKNETGILTAESLDKKLCYNYEVSIPLSLLGLDIKKEKSFFYHIILNGVTDRSNKVNIIETAKGDRITYIGADGISYVVASVGGAGMALAFPTDFWGKYTLTEK